MILIFFRKGADDDVEFFYPVEYPDDVKTPEQLATDSADCNPGTVRVEDIEGNVLWKGIQPHRTS